MRDLDVKTLRLFVAVCESRTMARAAEQEHIEPSAISKRIAQLEDDLGVELLVRGRRGVQTTPAGLALLEHARSVLFTMDRIVADAASFAGGVQGHVRLIATASAMVLTRLAPMASHTSMNRCTASMPATPGALRMRVRTSRPRQPPPRPTSDG